MESWRKAGFGNEHIFRVARTENAVALLDAAWASLREAGFAQAAQAVSEALLPVRDAATQARLDAHEAGYPLNQGWPEGGRQII